MLQLLFSGMFVYAQIDLLFLRYSKMKWILIFFISTPFFCIGQKEASVWALSPNASLDFNSGTAVLTPNSTVADFFEANSSICDENGNLLFYSNGETVWGADNSILPNGADLTAVSTILVSTSTQGTLIIKQPKSNDIYYLFSLGGTGVDLYQRFLSYSIIDMSLNGLIGAVVEKKNNLITDSLAEKLTATKHCNGDDIWVVVLKFRVFKYENSNPSDYELEFQSYLVTKNGVQLSPVRSNVKAIGAAAGQMKFNNAGTELAFGETNHLVLFNFNKETGVVSLKQEIKLPLKNAYGVEYSPNDSIIYLNEKQYDFQTQELTSLLAYDCFTPLQRGLDNKIYAILLPDEQVATIISAEELDPFTNGGILQGNTDNTNYISVIDNPNISGVACNLLLNQHSIFIPNDFRNFIALPNIPSYHFNHKPSDFSYSGTCPGEVFNFFLSNNPTVDSVHWFFHESNTNLDGTTTQFSFLNSGDYQVTCTVFQNGIATSTTQCVNVCGVNEVTLPRNVDLCDVEPFEINTLNTCSANYSWNTGDSTSAIFIDSEGLYVLKTTNECGVFYDTMEVVKSDACNVLVEIPNVITANNDGINDLFGIDVKNTKAFNYTIINRWGNLLMQNDFYLGTSKGNYWNHYDLWDGKTFDGNDVADGVYFYKIEFTALNDSKLMKSGFIEVVH